ncbi:metallophosphoesterase family protein [Sedimentitalea sp. HM32M-2]|uniref:metallophosphoesterase family protein n=1 Tax=Sedimentitalea sp. HM32M-2 TaxID=3351566 RepID=UPI00363BA6FC
MSNTPIYVVGDIHGQIDQLYEALDLITAEGGPEAEIVFLGDLVDRGPDSRAVIRLLLDGLAAGRRWHVLKGNHDQMFARFMASGETRNTRVRSGVDWLHPRVGGSTTLASYGLDDIARMRPAAVHAAARQAVPAEHVAFVDGLTPYHLRDDVLFVHAGIAPGVALADQSEEDLLWIREPFLSFAEPHPWLVVHGHTALQMPHHFGNRIDLDGGAGHGRTLYPAVLEGRDCWLLTRGGRVQLVP